MDIVIYQELLTSCYCFKPLGDEILFSTFYTCLFLLLWKKKNWGWGTPLATALHMVKNPNWLDADQLAMNKARTRIWTRDYVPYSKITFNTTSSSRPSPLSRWRVGAQKTLANSRSRVSKHIGDFDCFKMVAGSRLANFVVTWPVVRQGLFRAAILNAARMLGARLPSIMNCKLLYYSNESAPGLLIG